MDQRAGIGVKRGQVAPEGTTKKRIRKTKPWAEKSHETKRKEIADLANTFSEFPREKLLLAVAKCMRSSGERALAEIITYCASDASLSDDMLKRIEMKIDDVKQISPRTALAMHIDCNLSKQSYVNIAKVVNTCGKFILPCYDKIREAKSECAPKPEFITVNDTSGEVVLNELLKHTAQRVVKMQKKVFLHQREVLADTILTFEISWGMDGSSGYSNYKQGYDELDRTANEDSSVFAIAVNPLRLHFNETVFWNNRTPQSYRFCRPLKIMFAKETKSLVLEQKKWVEDQIANLGILEVAISDNFKVKIRFDLHLTIIDGKVLSIIQGTSCQSCPVCWCTPVQFNTEANLSNGKFAPKPGSLIYGLSVLHSYIRVLEYLLKIAYRLDFKKWQATADYKDMLKLQKARIQRELWAELKLRVDFPNAGGSGNSNDGNTARKAFQNYQIFAKVLNIKEDIVLDFRTILVALSSQFPINVTKFRTHCHQLHQKLLVEYGWYRLPSSVHKILVHGSEIIEASPLPVGVLAEDCAESRNKFYKFDRTHRARKTSRKDTMTDVFYRGLHTSDPIISSNSLNARYSTRNRIPLPKSVLALLDEPMSTFPVTQNDNIMELEVPEAHQDIVLENEDEDE